MPARPTTQVDDERVRVTEWCFDPGAETGWHTHEMDYVVVPMLDGLLRIDDGTAVVDVPLHAGQSYARPAGVHHNVINANDFTYRFIEVELKGPSA